MRDLPDFMIQSRGPVSETVLRLGFRTFHEIAAFVRDLPYGRNTDRSDYRLILTEGKGTCSTKHALLAALCGEHGKDDIRLYTGIYQMNGQNTPGTGPVLSRHGLTHVPEAHCYLKFNDERFDFTRPGAKAEGITAEKAITPEQIGEDKVRFHRRYTSEWIKTENLPYELKDVWQIREQCIEALAEGEGR
ncbi:hypothetical protein [Alteribacter natronophilus]|uniref:hypothetical protein n=1 Tax=Alteribacter natronophilus TaxID=2583810 RepID=UPI00110EA66A|nr:hypothetical protein [Alteribacter natronophilus]TMW71046.1 hypothetical protein FGB90_13840 [Alteribacter natronophilus]